MCNAVRRQDVKADRSQGLLHHLRYLSSFCEATDKRDKVYALFGLATDAERSEPYIDYSESIAQVYHSTVKVLVEQGRGIEVLYEAAYCVHLLGLPSWVPNWGAGRALESLGWTTSAQGVNIFRATGSARSTVKVSAADSRVLHVRGIRLDRTEAITEPSENRGTSDIVSERLMYLWSFERASRALVHRHEIPFATQCFLADSHL